jgi:heat shock protein HtpX
VPSLYTHQAENLRRTWLLFGVFVLLIGALGWGLSVIWDSPVVFPIALGVALVTSLGSYWFSDRLVVALAGARPIEKKDDPELYRLVENLAIAGGLPTPRVYLIDDPAPNAFATGRDAQHAIVAVTTGLRQRLQKEELEGVLAHELSHIGNRDMLVATVAAVLAGLVVTVVHLVVRLGFGGGRSRDHRGAGGLFGVLALLAFLLAPLAATLLRLAISRQREFLADASGALLTRYPDGLARALEKIGSSSPILRRAPEATAHLWISDPKRSTSSASFVTRLFLTHPPIPERVRRLRALQV